MRGRVAGAAALAVALAAGTTGAAAQAKPKKAGPKWRVLAGAAPRLVGSLNQVEFLSTKYGWAAGVEGADNALALWKWNGRKWTRAKAGWNFAPAGLAVSGPKKAWLTGVTLTSAHALYYNGKSWREVAFPGPGAPVDLAAAPDGTAVSVAQNVLTGVNTVHHWKDGKWRRLDVPLPSGTSLSAVAVGSKEGHLAGRRPQRERRRVRVPGDAVEREVLEAPARRRHQGDHEDRRGRAGEGVGAQGLHEDQPGALGRQAVP